jgi:hypothetical protein
VSHQHRAPLLIFILPPPIPFCDTECVGTRLLLCPLKWCFLVVHNRRGGSWAFGALPGLVTLPLDWGCSSYCLCSVCGICKDCSRSEKTKSSRFFSCTAYLLSTSTISSVSFSSPSPWEMPGEDSTSELHPSLYNQLNLIWASEYN